MINLDKILQKLEPIVPEEVKQWRKIREMGSKELIELVEKRIISTAYQVFGDYQSKILLSLPSAQKARGPINLGTILYDQEKWPLGITTSEFTQNMAILGRSGAGKTNVTFHIVRQLIDRRIPFVFMDWKRTVRHLIPQLGHKINVYTPGRSISKFPFNPFLVPPGIEANIYINQLVDILSHAFTLGDGARSILRKAINTLYQKGNSCPLVSDIIREIENVPDTGRRGSWKISALRAMESLDFADISSKNRISQQQLAEKLLHGNTVIELDALAHEGKKFLIPILCLWLYYVRLQSADREKLRLVIFIEEAHHVLYKRPHASNETVLEMLFRQCRELGIGIVVIDQQPHLLSSAALGNTYTSVFLNQKDPADIQKAAGICLMDPDDKKYFSMLPVGQGIVKLQDRWTQPIHVQFPWVNVNKGSVTDAMLARYSAVQKTDSGRKMSKLPGFKQVPRFPLYDIPLNDWAFQLIEDVLAHPDDGVKIRYKRLGLGAGTGNRAKELLLEQGWLESQVVDIGRTRKVLLSLTPKAREILGFHATRPEYGSIIHEYWKRYYGQRFQEQGYRVEYEVPRKSSGRTDIVATKGGKKTAVEIETGKSDFVKNVKQDLLAGFDQIRVVATDKKALEKLEKGLAKEGLLGVGRIEVVLQDKW